jgi:hypothetical protein
MLKMIPSICEGPLASFPNNSGTKVKYCDDARTNLPSHCNFISVDRLSHYLLVVSITQNIEG